MDVYSIIGYILLFIIFCFFVKWTENCLASIGLIMVLMFIIGSIIGAIENQKFNSWSPGLVSLCVGLLFLIVGWILEFQDFRKINSNDINTMYKNKYTSELQSSMDEITPTTYNGIGIARILSFSSGLYYNFFVICWLPIVPLSCYSATDIGEEYGTHKKKYQKYVINRLEKIKLGEILAIYLIRWSIPCIIYGLGTFI